jgi:predicted nucleic acid-binding protein
MLYWDSSALVASFINEQSTDKIRSFSIKVGTIQSYTAIITPLEIESAIQRKLKEQSITAKQADQARRLTTDFRRQSHLVIGDQTVLDLALHLQKIYSLRVADAFQLASARAGTDDPSKVNFLCLDRKLNEAAEQEGFHVPF